MIGGGGGGDIVSGMYVRNVLVGHIVRRMSLTRIVTDV